jgi:hypothetical protein
MDARHAPRLAVHCHVAADAAPVSGPSGNLVDSVSARRRAEGCPQWYFQERAAYGPGDCGTPAGQRANNAPARRLHHILVSEHAVFRPCFTAPVWNHLLVLVAGAVLAPGGEELWNSDGRGWRVFEQLRMNGTNASQSRAYRPSLDMPPWVIAPAASVSNQGGNRAQTNRAVVARSAPRAKASALSQLALRKPPVCFRPHSDLQRYHDRRHVRRRRWVSCGSFSRRSPQPRLPPGWRTPGYSAP